MEGEIVPLRELAQRDPEHAAEQQIDQRRALRYWDKDARADVAEFPVSPTRQALDRRDGGCTKVVLRLERDRYFGVLVVLEGGSQIGVQPQSRRRVAVILLAIDG